MLKTLKNHCEKTNVYVNAQISKIRHPSIKAGIHTCMPIIEPWYRIYQNEMQTPTGIRRRSSERHLPK